MESRLPDYDKLLTGQPIWKARMDGVGILPLEGCMQLGVTGPILRSAGLPWDLRKVMPYCGYEDYDFEVPDVHRRRLLRPVPAAAGRDARVAQDHEAGASSGSKSPAR